MDNKMFKLKLDIATGTYTPKQEDVEWLLDIIDDLESKQCLVNHENSGEMEYK